MPPFAAEFSSSRTSGSELFTGYTFTPFDHGSLAARLPPAQ